MCSLPLRCVVGLAFISCNVKYGPRSVSPLSQIERILSGSQDAEKLLNNEVKVISYNHPPANEHEK